jgi:hypothetical protein
LSISPTSDWGTYYSTILSSTKRAVLVCLSSEYRGSKKGRGSVSKEAKELFISYVWRVTTVPPFSYVKVAEKRKTVKV